MAMHTANEVIIHAPVDIVYELAGNIERWPLLLEHYRYVKVLEDLERSDEKQVRIVKMSATRTGIPTSWTSIQEMYPGRREVRYRWINGIPKGMEVVWRIEPLAEGVRVTIDHDLEQPRWRWLDLPLARYIMGHVFIEYVAGQTLAGMKRHAEAAARLQQTAHPASGPSLPRRETP